METQLTYNNKSRHLGIRFRERYTTREGLQAKVRKKMENRGGKRKRERRNRRRAKRPFFFFRNDATSPLSITHPDPCSFSSFPLSLKKKPPLTTKGRRRARHRHGRPRVLRPRREDHGPAPAGRQRALEAQARVARQAARGRGRLVLLAPRRVVGAALGRGVSPPRRRALGGSQGRARARHEDAGDDGGGARLRLQKPFRLFSVAAASARRRRRFSSGREREGHAGPLSGGEGEQLVCCRGRQGQAGRAV